MLEVLLSLYNQVAPLEEVGKFEYLPDPSCQDCETAYTFKLRTVVKFLCSVGVNFKYTLLVELLKVE